MQTVALALANEEQPANNHEGLPDTVGHELKGSRSAFVYAGFLLIAGVTMSTLGDKVLHNKSASNIGMLIALVGVLVLLLRGLLLVAGGGGAGQGRSRGLPPAEKTTGLPQPLLSAQPLSVTEQTTRQLEPTQENRAFDPDERGTRDTQPTL
ncbi:MAG: hypothetical protein ACREAC_31100 [Blastocatellia bacterium]